MAQNNRDLALAQSNELQNQLGAYTNYQGGQALNYQEMANSAYAPIASGQGGYTPQEQAAILNLPYLQSLPTSQSALQSNYLTPDEQAGITGNPYGVMQQLGQDEGNLDAANTQWAGFTSDAMNAQDQNVNAALGGSATGVRGAVGQEYQNISNVLTQTNPAVNNTLQSTASNVNPYITNPNLLVSNEYLQNYQVSPQDMQDIMNEAGSSVANQELSDEERLMQEANQQGNVSPLALNTARERLRQNAAVNEAQALTQARIQAKQLQLNTAQQRENTRLGAQQTYSGLGSSANLALGQQGLTGQEYLGQLGLLGSAQEGAAAIGAEQYLGNQATQAQQYLGGSRIANTQQLGQQAQGIAQWEAGTNLGAGQTAEQTASQRAAQVAANRQATNQYNQGTQFGQGAYVYGQGSQANQNFANQRLQQEQEYRNYLMGQQTQANQNQTVGQQQQLGLYGATNQGLQGATTGAIQNYAVPGEGTTIFKSILGGGKYGMEASGPHEALVGEAGPELIIDLAEDPRKPGSYAKKAAGGDFGSPNYDSGETESVSSSDTSARGTEITRGQDVSKRANPLYLAILRGMAGQDPNSNQWDPSARPPVGKGGGGIKALAGSILPLFLAEGGVVNTAAGQKPHHFYGNKNRLKNRIPEIPSLAPSGVKIPHVELVTHPQVRTLGARVPQAVVPLTPRRSNKITPAMIPGLMQKYGGYASKAVV
jgi:hypothetical protein